MEFRSFLSRFRSPETEPEPEPFLPARQDERATTLTFDRPLTQQEREIAEWLLKYAGANSAAFIPQLDHIRVVGGCSCGCPTVDLKVAEGTPPATPQDNPICDALGYVNGKMVGVMMFQRDGYLTLLEVYDLSDIEHPYPMPDVGSLRLFETSMSGLIQ